MMEAQTLATVAQREIAEQFPMAVSSLALDGKRVVHVLRE
jgi:hypothetical protein